MIKLINTTNSIENKIYNYVMKGIYVLTSNMLKLLDVLKFGMSMTLETRWHDYITHFPDAHYIACYKFADDYQRDEILYIESIILEKTKEYQDITCFGIEYRFMKYKEIHKVITEVLLDYNIEYELIENAIFPNPINKKKAEMNITIEDLENIKINIPNIFIRNKQNNKIQIKLRDYQQECLDIFIKLLNKGEYFQGVYSLATGLGKSWITTACCLKHLELYPSDNILWMCFRNDIVDSQLKMFKSFPDIFMICTRGKQDISEISKKVRGKVFVILRHALQNNTLEANSINGIVYDECQDACKISIKNENDEIIEGKTYEILLKLGREHNLKYRIGFSATPLTNDTKQNQGMIKLYGNNKRVNYLYNMSIIEGVEQGYLLEPVIEYVMFNLDTYDLRKFYDVFSIKEMDDKMIENKYNTLTEQIILQVNNCIDKMTYKKGIIWFSSVRIMLYFYNKLKDYYKSKLNVYYSWSGYAENDDIFRIEEENSLMLACQKFTVGYDGVNMEFGINTVLNESGYITVQKLGRFERNNKPKQNHAYLFQFCQYYKNDLTELTDSIVRNYEALSIKANDINKIKGKESPENKINKMMLNFININIDNQIIDYDKIKMMVISRRIRLETSELPHVSYKECKKIIEVYKTKYNRQLNSKEDYYKLSKEDDRLPLDAESLPDFIGWIDYLLIDREKYYATPEQVKESVKQIRQQFKNEFNNINKDDFSEIYRFCQSKDNKLPLMPVEFYKNEHIHNIGYFIDTNLKKKQKVI